MLNRKKTKIRGADVAGTLDQQQTNFGGTDLTISSVSSWAQTFTAGVSGKLDQFDLFLSKTGSPSAPLSIEVRDVSAGALGGTVLASSSLPARADQGPGGQPR